ncbi:MAG: hypothetical protein ABI091_26715 [Ferruginibacter sp.]
MEEKELYTLMEGVEEYLALRQIDKKKYLPSYLISAKFAWKRLFKWTIYAINSEWLPLQKGTPYNYINKPKDCSILFSVCNTDKHNKMQELFYDNLTNIIPKPSSSIKKCGCGCSDCGGLCEDVNSLTYTTKVLFTINGIDYVEKDWVKVCPNGDVIEYKIVPTKKYNTYTGDGGDYMNDYNNDYSIGTPPFSDYTIVYPEFQNIICKLAVKECGCPEDTDENIDLLNTYCGCYLRLNAHCKRERKKEDFLGEINTCNGRIKMSECGTKIYYIPDGKYGSQKIPDYLLVNWQTTGEKCGSYVQVPDYAILALFFGIDYYSKVFNSSYSQLEKDSAKYAFNAEENNVILDLNRLSLKKLSEIQDIPILF